MTLEEKANHLESAAVQEIERGNEQVAEDLKGLAENLRQLKALAIALVTITQHGTCSYGFKEECEIAEKIIDEDKESES
jgi:hypothetical protein